MTTLVRRIGAGAVLVAAVTLTGAGIPAATGVAAAADVIPFQVDPAPFGNPNGSFDVPPIRCVAVVGDDSSVTISGGKDGRWGCLIHADVHWVNLATGGTGSARMSDGLNGFPPEATLHTGSGPVALVLLPLPGNVTPGVAAFPVP